MDIRAKLKDCENKKIPHQIITIDGKPYLNIIAFDYSDNDIARLVVHYTTLPPPNATVLPNGLVQVSVPYNMIKDVITFTIDEDLYNKIPEEVLNKFSKENLFEQY